MFLIFKLIKYTIILGIPLLLLIGIPKNKDDLIEKTKLLINDPMAHVNSLKSKIDDKINQTASNIKKPIDDTKATVEKFNSSMSLEKKEIDKILSDK